MPQPSANSGNDTAVKFVVFCVSGFLLYGVPRFRDSRSFPVNFGELQARSEIEHFLYILVSTLMQNKQVASHAHPYLHRRESAISDTREKILELTVGPRVYILVRVSGLGIRVLGV